MREDQVMGQEMGQEQEQQREQREQQLAPQRQQPPQPSQPQPHQDQPPPPLGESPLCSLSHVVLLPSWGRSSSSSFSFSSLRESLMLLDLLALQLWIPWLQQVCIVHELLFLFYKSCILVPSVPLVPGAAIIPGGPRDDRTGYQTTMAPVKENSQKAPMPLNPSILVDDMVSKLDFLNPPSVNLR